MCILLQIHHVTVMRLEISERVKIVWKSRDDSAKTYGNKDSLFATNVTEHSHYTVLGCQNHQAK